MTPQLQRNLAIGALVVLVMVVITATYYHQRWMKKNCVCVPAGFVIAKGVYNPGAKPQASPPTARPKAAGEKFTADVDHWPTSGTFGNLADTNPYGNYAEGLQMLYPSYEEEDSL